MAGVQDTRNETPDEFFRKQQAEILKRRQINSWLKLGQLPMPEGQTYSVHAWFLTTDADAEGRQGFNINLGNYKSRAKAENRVKEVQALGHPFVCISEGWHPLSHKVSGNIYTKPDMGLPLYLKHQSDLEEYAKQDEINEKYRQQLEQDALKREDPNSTQHYLHHLYLTLTCWGRARELRARLQEAEAAQNKHLEALREQLSRQPEMDSKILTEAKRILAEQKDETTYPFIEKYYPEVRKMLGLVDGDRKEEPAK